VADTGNDRVQAFTRGGALVPVTNSAKSRPAPARYVTCGHEAIGRGCGRIGNDRHSIAGRLKAPEGIAVDAAGNVYVADTGNRRVVQYTWWGGFVRGFGEFGRPRAVAVDPAGRLLVDDDGRVARFDTRTGAALPDATEWVSSPRDSAGDGAGGVWVADTGNHRIVHFGVPA
jgi:DNA-binding beta-propeller fold protein YncE